MTICDKPKARGFREKSRKFKLCLVKGGSWFIGWSTRPKEAGPNRLARYNTRARRAARGGGGGGRAPRRRVQRAGSSKVGGLGVFTVVGRCLESRPIHPRNRCSNNRTGVRCSYLNARIVTLPLWFEQWHFCVSRSHVNCDMGLTTMMAAGRSSGPAR